MKKKKFIKIARNVIELEIQALKKLKNSINNSFNQAVQAIVKCQSKIIFCGVGKSSKISAKLSSTFSSVGSPSFTLSASDASHGDLGSISKKDVLILISYSGETSELKNIIQYAKRNKIILIGIVSKKNSTLYKASDIKLFVPEVKESGYGIVPTSSTSAALAIGDALAIASMEQKKFNRIDFKKIHPAGSLGAKLKTVEDVMIRGKKIPFISENQNLKKAIKVISKKKLGVLIITKKNNKISGILTDGDIRRIVQKNTYLPEEKIKNLMKKKPISIEKDTLAAEALEIMNSKKITSLSVYDKRNKSRIIGLVHIHNILEAKIA
mgnify:FL=1